MKWLITLYDTHRDITYSMFIDKKPEDYMQENISDNPAVKIKRIQVFALLFAMEIK